MAVIDERYSSRRDVGAPVGVTFLQKWFETNAAMSEAAREDEKGPDPGDLAEMELKARKGLGDLEKMMAEARSQDHFADSQLAGIYLKVNSEERQTGARVAGDLAVERLRTERAYREMADAEAEMLGKKIAVSPKTQGMIDRFDPSGMSAETAAAQFEGFVLEEKAGGVGDAKYDHMLADYTDRIKATNPAMAREVGRKLNPGMEPDEDPATFYSRVHTPTTLKKAREDAIEAGGRNRAGLSAGGARQDLADIGMSPADLRSARSGGSSSGRRANDDDDGPRTRSGGSGAVSMEGLSGPAAEAFAADVAAGKDPYESLASAIRAQRDYADSLAAQRREATANRKSRYPSANIYTTTPNRYVSERGQAAARRVGEADPFHNQFLADELSRNKGNIRKATDALRESGQDADRFAPLDYQPEDVEDGGDLGAWLASRIEAGEDVEAVLGAQPASVQALFANARTLAAKSPKDAADLAREVRPDEVRAAYGEALQRFEDPGEAQRILAGLDALPEEAAGGFRDKTYDAMDRYARGRATGGYQAMGQLRGSLQSLGKALIASGDVKERREARDRRRFAGDADEEGARSEFAKGQSLVRTAWEKADTDEKRAKVIDAWKRAAEVDPSPLTQGAIAAVGEFAFKGGPSPTAEKQRTGRLQMEKAAPPPAKDIVIAGESLDKRGEMVVNPKDNDPLAPIGAPEDEFATFNAQWKAPPVQKAEAPDDDLAEFNKTWKGATK